MKRETTICENIFANDTSDKGLISTIYRENSHNSTPGRHVIQLKMGKGPDRHFSKEDIQNVQRHIKGCSASLAIREMQIKTTMRNHFTPVRMTTKNKSTNKCW